MAFFCINIRSKKALALLFVLIIILILSIQFFSAFSMPVYNGETIEQRIEFLNSFEILADFDSERVKESVLPNHFDENYLKYNDLQKQAGFDLLLYKGCEVKIFSYENENTEVHLIVCNKKIIGGHIVLLKQNGEIKSLNYEINEVG